MHFSPTSSLPHPEHKGIPQQCRQLLQLAAVQEAQQPLAMYSSGKIPVASVFSWGCKSSIAPCNDNTSDECWQQGEQVMWNSNHECSYRHLISNLFFVLPPAAGMWLDVLLHTHTQLLLLHRWADIFQFAPPCDTLQLLALWDQNN